TLVKKLWEIRKSYEGDMIEAGWRVAGILGFATAKLFSWDWKRLGSPMQLDVVGKRIGVPAWFANGRRKFWDMMEHYDVIPPNEYCYYPGFDKNYTIHNLRRLNHAEDHDVWTEIIMGTVALSVALTFWNAFTAKDEEESGGGGGHQ
ncbi:hypothetical protein HY945_05355, partial [Candidatus Gottesmanbacteria bacterium]|nr:hypothetical protein [Candidatus Gottesmanbacteria bacterium]